MTSEIINIKNIDKLPKNSVLAYGHFTTIHAGHIRYLRHAKKLGSNLIVALLGDDKRIGDKKYAFKQNERAEALSLLSIADYIVLMENVSLKFLSEKLYPKVLVLGKEFENTREKDIKESIQFQLKNKCEVQFHAGDINYASADLLKNSESELSLSRKKLFVETCSREGLNKERLINLIKKWGDTHLLVVGDSIIDQYAACEPLGLSAEAPVVVVKELEKRNFLGGAAIVANHVKTLGAKCTFISVVGEDDEAKYLEQQLSERNIDYSLILDNSRPTTFKKRYVVENQKLFRVSKLEEHSLDREIEEKIILQLRKYASSCDGIIISDFVYGVITKKIIQEIKDLSVKYKLMIFGDVQCSSQIGDITNFKDFSLLCPNEKETRIALKDNVSGLEKLSQKIIKITNTKRLIMKLGADGFIAYDNSGSRIKTQSFPALSVNPLDVAGAGDSLLAVMAIGLSSNQTLISTSAIGCCMASIAVETMGNSPISKEKLIEKLINVFQFA